MCVDMYIHIYMVYKDVIYMMIMAQIMGRNGCKRAKFLYSIEIILVLIQIRLL